jgi:hypothetical protein
VSETAPKPDGYLAEFDFIHEGMRQDQRERHGFLGFTLAASGLVLGLLMRAKPPLEPPQVFYLVGLVALVTCVAERLTLRSSQGVATAGAYLRLFVEPKVDGLGYQRRNLKFLHTLDGNVSSSRGFAVAYFGVTVAFGLAWVIAPIKAGTDREIWQTLSVVVLVVLSLIQVGTLWLRSTTGWKSVNDAWEAVFDSEAKRDGIATAEDPQVDESR